jgi:hypothetical protein
MIQIHCKEANQLLTKRSGGPLWAKAEAKRYGTGHITPLEFFIED